jgi:hypothetical protein
VTARCLNPLCDTGDPIRSFLNPWYCGGACELAHKRLLEAGPPPPWLVVQGNEVEVTIEPDISRYEAAMERARQQPANPLLAAKVQAEADRARVEDGFRRLWADVQAADPPSAATAWPADRLPSFVELAEMVRNLPPSPEPVKVTRAEWEYLKFTSPPVRRPDVYGGEIGAFAGVPVKIVDPTPRPGWLARWKARLFG